MKGVPEDINITWYKRGDSKTKLTSNVTSYENFKRAVISVDTSGNYECEVKYKDRKIVTGSIVKFNGKK